MIEIRILSPELVAPFTKFLEQLASDPTSAQFHPHPMTPEVAALRCEYSGKDIYAVLLHNGDVAAYGMLRGWDEGFAIPSLGRDARRLHLLLLLALLFFDLWQLARLFFRHRLADRSQHSSGHPPRRRQSSADTLQKVRYRHDASLVNHRVAADYRRARTDVACDLPIQLLRRTLVSMPKPPYTPLQLLAFVAIAAGCVATFYLFYCYPVLLGM